MPKRQPMLLSAGFGDTFVDTPPRAALTPTISGAQTIPQLLSETLAEAGLELLQKSPRNSTIQTRAAQKAAQLIWMPTLPP
jgi:hypothetical protein